MFPHYELRKLSRHWWVFLLAGLAWLVVGAIVLRFDVTSVATVGLLLGAVFLFTAVSEFTLAAFQGGGWAILRVILGVLFIGGSIWSFTKPYDAFWALAAAFGLLLILAGGFDIAYSAMSEGVNSLWWLGVVTGLLMIGLGFWASQQYLPARAVLLVLWVGIYAIFKGVQDIVLAFEVQSLGRHHPGHVDGADR